MAKFDVAGARKEGYTDAEIADHLAKLAKFNVNAARQEGYTDAEIVQHLSATNVSPSLQAASAELDARRAYARRQLADAKAKVAKGQTGYRQAVTRLQSEVAKLDRMTPEQVKRNPSELASLGKGFAEGVANVAAKPFDWLTQGLAAAGVSGAKEQVSRSKQARNAAAASTRQEREAHPNYFATGKVGGEIVATAPMLSGLGAGISKIPGATRFGQAVATGGVGTGRTAAQTAALSRTARTAQLATRMAGGAVSGGTGAALTDQDVTSGALVGGGLPVVAGVVRKVGGKAIDFVRGRGLDIEAAKMIRKALGKDVEAARAEFAKLSPDDKRLAQQVLIDAGIEPNTYIAMAEDVSQLRPEARRATLEGLKAARDARLAQAAGGATATETRAATARGRQAVSEATAPARETALTRANIAGQEVPEAERIAAAARARANQITESGIVPNMRALEERTAEQAAIMGDHPAIFPDMENIQRTRGISGAAGERANQAIEQQVQLRGIANDMEDHVANLAAEGMTPLKVTPIVSKLRAMAAAPGTRADDLQRNTLTRLANKLEGLANEDGVIDAQDLYQVRKTGINDIVDRLLGGRALPASGTKERTAGLLSSIRPMIDDAIEGAGGTGWKDYITRTRQGFEAVNRQELAAKGAQLAKENPEEFTALMAGERPQVVEDIMGKGSGQYDISGLALADPLRYNALQQSAKEINTLNRMRELATSGRRAANEIMTPAIPSKLRSATRVALSTVPGVRIAAEGAENLVSNLMAPKLSGKLAESTLTGQNALTAMNQYPTSMTADELMSGLSPQTRNIIAQVVRNQLAPSSSSNGY